MANKQTDKLRKLTKQVTSASIVYGVSCSLAIGVPQVQEARHNHDEELVKKTVEEYDETLEWYICVCECMHACVCVLSQSSNMYVYFYSKHVAIFQY